MATDIFLSSIPISELKEVISEVLDEKFNSNPRQPLLNKKEEDYATRKEVAKRLRISLPTLTTYIKEGRIPYHRIGRRVLFKWDEVQEVLEQIETNKYKRRT